MKKNTLPLVLALSYFASFQDSQAQGSWTYDFRTSDDPLPAAWVESSNTASYAVKISGDNGINHAVDPSGVGAITYMDPGIDASVNIIHTANSYSLAPGTAATYMTMGWSAHPHSGLQDDGTSAGNEIFQIGLVSATTGLMGVAASGAESFYLAGVETSASLAAGETTVLLAMADTNGGLGAFNGGVPITFNAEDYHVFKIGMTPDLAGNISVTLEMDTFTSGGGSYAYTGNTNFGSISVANNVGKLGNLFPALGLKLEDSSMVSISGANFDTAPVPEPSSSLLFSLGSSLLLFRRKR